MRLVQEWDLIFLLPAHVEGVLGSENMTALVVSVQLALILVPRGGPTPFPLPTALLFDAQRIPQDSGQIGFPHVQ